MKTFKLIPTTSRSWPLFLASSISPSSFVISHPKTSPSLSQNVAAWWCPATSSAPSGSSSPTWTLPSPKPSLFPRRTKTPVHRTPRCKRTSARSCHHITAFRWNSTDRRVFDRGPAAGPGPLAIQPELPFAALIAPLLARPTIRSFAASFRWPVVPYSPADLCAIAAAWSAPEMFDLHHNRDPRPVRGSRARSLLRPQLFLPARSPPPGGAVQPGCSYCLCVARLHRHCAPESHSAAFAVTVHGVCEHIHFPGEKPGWQDVDRRPCIRLLGPCQTIFIRISVLPPKCDARI